MVDNGKYRVNEEIVGVREVRLVDESGESKIISVAEARHRAEDEGLDLVEIAAQAVPPVCKILDFQKFRYMESKREKETAKRQRVANKLQEVKEIRFRPVTDENDYQVKVKSLIRFLEEGYRAKATIKFRGREMSHTEFGVEMLERLTTDIEEFGLPEAPTKNEGKNLAITFVPKKK